MKIRHASAAFRTAVGSIISLLAVTPLTRVFATPVRSRGVCRGLKVFALLLRLPGIDPHDQRGVFHRVQCVEEILSIGGVVFSSDDDIPRADARDVLQVIPNAFEQVLEARPGCYEWQRA